MRNKHSLSTTYCWQLSLLQPFQTTFGWSFLRSSTSERLIVGGAGEHQNDLLLVSFGAFKRLIVGKKRIMLFFKHLLTKKSFCANMYIEVKRQ